MDKCTKEVQTHMRMSVSMSTFKAQSDSMQENHLLVAFDKEDRMRGEV